MARSYPAPPSIVLNAIVVDQPGERGSHPFTPEPCPLARLPSSHAPILCAAVHTEEEFDWLAPLRRDATGVRAMAELWRLQEVFEAFHIRPAYLIDYPIAAQPQGTAPLRPLVARGAAEIGAHLHPWVCPPFEETVTPQASYPGNLPPQLERAKLRVLVAAIREGVGVEPRTYLAGRYGLGPNTARLLEEEGFEVDLSASPAHDFRADGGPDYRAMPADPYWFGERRPLLGLPTTGAFVGWLGRAGAALYGLVRRPWLAWTRLAGALARLGMVERLRLSPEGHTLDDLRRLTRALLRHGVRVFSFSLHSPTLMPGCTPYVRSEADLKAFLATCRSYFDWFLGELAGRSMTPLELKAYLLQNAAPPVKARP